MVGKLITIEKNDDGRLFLLFEKKIDSDSISLSINEIKMITLLGRSKND